MINLDLGVTMSAEFLKWFLAQKPFRRSRLVTYGGMEHLIERPEEIDVDERDNTFRLYAMSKANFKMYRGTYALGDIEEIRQ